MLVVDLILPPRSGKIPISSFCVENGRWSQRGNEQVSSFGSSANIVAGRDLKLAAKVEGSQSEVWRQAAAPKTSSTPTPGARGKAGAPRPGFNLQSKTPKCKTPP